MSKGADMDDHRFEEKRLAKVLGLARDTLRMARSALEEGPDWRLGHGRVLYSKKGVMRLLDALGVRLPEKKARQRNGATLARVLQASQFGPAADQKPTSAAAVLWRPQEQELEVVRVYPKNRHILLARPCSETLGPKGHPYLDPDGNVRVRVRTTEKFCEGMRMVCQHVEEDLWEFDGRCPRWRGRW